ncbi:hypothetical protein [Bradyrhizobium sp. SZCCHNRI20481]|uniref:hypothetical protein n=1 Tax=Bradyrhizobium sp. SZCCHNRI20481 TaxID=3057286 RepID=UPI002915E4A8|nr:hypothetical protein [Bradyrhizobium sp. SZCCHNRI20481]
MNDSEARGIVLKKFYDLRGEQSHLEMADLETTGLPRNTVERILEQLGEQRLINWNPRNNNMGGPNRYTVIMASISSFGVDVVEGATQPPIAITIDASVNVHGSQGVQVGGQGNVLNVTLDVERLNSFIDSSGASVHDKEEAKGLLKRLAENPLVKGAFEWLLKSYTGK